MRAAAQPVAVPPTLPSPRLPVGDSSSTAGSRPVLIRYSLAKTIGIVERVRNVDGRSGVVDMTEAELLALGATRVEWGEPDANGYYTPTLYAVSLVSIP